MRILRATLPVNLSMLLFLVGVPDAFAQSCCSHLGGSVQCPGTLPAGSRSLQFQEGGTLWQTPSGGIVFVPQSVFPACTPAAAQPAERPAVSVPVETPPVSRPTPGTPTGTPAEPSTSAAQPADRPSSETSPAAATPPASSEASPPSRQPSPTPVLPDRGRAAQDRARGLIDGRPVIVVPVPPASGQPPTDVDDRIRRLGKEIQQRYHTVPREPAGGQPADGTTPAAPTPPPKAAEPTTTSGSPGKTVSAPAECRLDLAVHRPISQDPDQPRVPKERQFRHGAFTLRNDDADARVGRLAGGGSLPVTTLPTTDLDRQGNALENDLVRVRASNPDGLKNVYLFAFALSAEADTKRATQIRRTGRPAPQANKGQLATWTDAFKGGQGVEFAMPVDASGVDFWVEGRLGGRYVFALGIVPEQARPADVVYLAEGDRAVKPVIPAKDGAPALELGCLEQARLTVVVLDIFQRLKDSVRDDSGGERDDPARVRENAFDVYWGGAPHFRAVVWPAGGRYTWGAPYRQGAAVKEVPGVALTGQAGAMPPGPEPSSVPSDRLARGKEIGGRKVTASGAVAGGPDAPIKVLIEGGLAVHRPTTGFKAAPGAFDPVGGASSPVVNRDGDDRYPHRISLAYTLNPGTPDAETLVRAEPLEVILPQLGRVPDPQPRVSSQEPESDRYEIASRVNYVIFDAFGRQITADSVAEYLWLYGAGLMAWEALRVEEGHAVEQGDLIRVARSRKEKVAIETSQFRIETAQRSQALLYRDRMVAGTFRDTLYVTLGNDRNRLLEEGLYWKGLDKNQYLEGFLNPWKKKFSQSKGDPAERARLDALDEASAMNNLLFRIRQDVVLQLRVSNVLHDVRVLRGNEIRVYFPYFLPDFVVDDLDSQGQAYKRWLSFPWMSFHPGADTRPVLLPSDFLFSPESSASPRRK